MKKIITIARAVIILLYNWLSAIYCTPGPDNSSRMRTEKAVPIKPANNANIKYKVPISLALVDKNHLSFHIVICVKLSMNFLSAFSWFILMIFSVFALLVRISLDPPITILPLATLTVDATAP